ncbi:hypothetical protein [Paenibacillus sp. IHBB 10380]|uniref:hypothetical protein n=1 Tax=Paenibacillus sp. IHBB 10380 TaxID=1566358 RepID=UPI0005CFD9CF|nr:hypothetical protein [Paenibacillus sp. IHBB 10380]AJS59240.1 hypothetical protein UB51_13055 [Paenibacillus sp. IHBB 10380]
MNRTQLVTEAKQAGRNAKYNLQVIRETPTKILPGKMENAEAYLEMMISFAKEEQKNARLAGRTLGLRTRLRNLVTSILTPESNKGKGEVV